jgi:chromosome segregation ATPase
VGNFTGIFRPTIVDEQDTDKLVDLFRNRSELKKEFAELRNEKYRLQDRIKEHRGSIERVQQQLSHLESLLLDPEWVHNVVAFYQLRRLGAHLEARVARFAEQLKQQREKRVQDQALEAWNERRDKERRQVDEAIEKHRIRLQMLEERLEEERHRLQAMRGLSKLRQGRSQEAQVEELEAGLTDARARNEALLEQRSRIDNQDLPPHEGLDIAAKRSINFMILSFAQQLYLDYHEDNLARMAKEASEKSVGAVNYGSKPDCDGIVAILQRRRDELSRCGESGGAALQERARHIAKHARFRDKDDAVPESGSVAEVLDIRPNGSIQRLDANLLGENYFRIADVLSR